MDEEKSPLIRLKEVVFRGSLCFTVSSLVYVAVMSAMLSGADGEPGAVFSLLLRNFAVILAASAVFGVSFMLFEVKWLPSAARRTFHILLLYADLIIAFLLMANVSGDTSGQVLFVFMATLIFIVLYGVSCIVSSVIRKRRGS